MTDREELEDRLGAVEEDLADTSDLPPMFVFPTDDGYETLDGDPVPTDADGEPDTDGSRPLFSLPPEVTDNWGPLDDDDDRGDT